jgi:hypothetical protein
VRRLLMLNGQDTWGSEAALRYRLEMFTAMSRHKCVRATRRPRAGSRGRAIRRTQPPEPSAARLSPLRRAATLMACSHVTLTIGLLLHPSPWRLMLLLLLLLTSSARVRSSVAHWDSSAQEWADVVAIAETATVPRSFPVPSQPSGFNGGQVRALT